MNIPRWLAPALSGIGAGCIAGILGDWSSAIAGAIITGTLLWVLEVGHDMRGGHNV